MGCGLGGFHHLFGGNDAFDARLSVVEHKVIYLLYEVIQLSNNLLSVKFILMNLFTNLDHGLETLVDDFFFLG